MAIDYKSEDVQARLKELCPKGIDIFFDNVGGDILDAALAQLAMRGRVVLCGGIANYNATEPPSGPKNYLNLIVQRGRMEGFLVLDYMSRAAEAIGALAGWVQAGKLKNKVDVQHGLENAPATLRRLFEGRNEGLKGARDQSGALRGYAAAVLASAISATRLCKRWTRHVNEPSPTFPETRFSKGIDPMTDDEQQVARAIARAFETCQRGSPKRSRTRSIRWPT